MAPAVTPFPTSWSLADLLGHLGDISPGRIRLIPAPGKATERDILTIEKREDRLYELVDGVLVEKLMGYPESTFALWLAHLLQTFLDENDLGILGGEAGPTRLLPGTVRIPDVSFLAWERLPSRTPPAEPILALAPDLAVEVLSKGNTRKEMKRKVKEYFLAGTRLVWLIDLQQRTVEAFTAPDQSAVLSGSQTLSGGAVLPGFHLPLAKLFSRLPAQPAGHEKAATTRKPRGKPRP